MRAWMSVAAVLMIAGCAAPVDDVAVEPEAVVRLDSSEELWDGVVLNGTHAMIVEWTPPAQGNQVLEIYAEGGRTVERWGVLAFANTTEGHVFLGAGIQQTMHPVGTNPTGAYNEVRTGAFRMDVGRAMVLGSVMVLPASPAFEWSGPLTLVPFGVSDEPMVIAWRSHDGPSVTNFDYEPGQPDGVRPLEGRPTWTATDAARSVAFGAITQQMASDNITWESLAPFQTQAGQTSFRYQAQGGVFVASSTHLVGAGVARLTGDAFGQELDETTPAFINTDDTCVTLQNSCAIAYGAHLGASGAGAGEPLATFTDADGYAAQFGAFGAYVHGLEIAQDAWASMAGQMN